MSFVSMLASFWSPFCIKVHVLGVLVFLMNPRRIFCTFGPKSITPQKSQASLFQHFSHIDCLCHFDVILDHFLMSFRHNIGSIWEYFWHHVGILLGHILTLFRIILCFHASLFVCNVWQMVCLRIFAVSFNLSADSIYIYIFVCFYSAVFSYLYTVYTLSII